jgi:hypothetical protein
MVYYVIMMFADDVGVMAKEIAAFERFDTTIFSN